MNVVSSTLATRTPGQASRMGTDADRSGIREYLRILMRWRFVVAGSVAACVVLALIATLLMTPKFTATAKVEITREADNVTNLQGVEREASVADQEFYQTQYGLLQSRSLSERVAMQLRLVDDPRFFELFGVSDDEPAFVLNNGRYPASGRAQRQRKAGELLLRHIDVVPTRLSRLVDIAFTSPDPALSAAVANAWAENFIRTNLERRFNATAYGRNVLQQQLGQLKERLDRSQRQLVDYASRQKIINLPAQSADGKTTAERSLVADELAALNGALQEATAARIAAEAHDARSGANGTSTEALRNIAINGLRQKRAELAADYQKLMTQFEPGYPAAKAIQSQINQLDVSIAREEGRVTGSAEADYREALQRENALRRRVDQLKSSYLDMRRRSIQYNIYQQEVDTNRALYDGLLQRFKEIGVAGGVGVNNVSIIDPADVPQKPSSPRMMLNLLAALVAGLGLGVVIAFALEQVDEAITDPAEVERRLGLPLLGVAPKVESGTPTEAMQDRKSTLVDAYLTVQTNLAFTTEQGLPRSLAVTSTRPAEGKSTTALAIATTLVRAQRKVILVDADMRSPSIHHLVDLSHDAGLSNFLAGTEDLDALIAPQTKLGFATMTAGPIPPNAAELLTGNRLGLLIMRLLDRYDHVVIDSPPVLGLADAPLIASRVDGVVYAVESHGTRSSVVKTALGRLSNTNARIFGIVLTKFQARKAHGVDYEGSYSYGRTENTGRRA